MYYDGLGRTIRQESFLTSSGDGNGTYIGADEFGVKIAPQTGYLDPTQSGDGIVTNDSSYDEAGFLLARRDDNGNTTAYIYDTLGRKIKERKGLNFTGSSLSIVGGQVADFFGALPGGEPVVITEPNGTDVTLSYTNRGFLLTRTDEVGNVFNYVNDALGRQTSITIVLGPAVIGTTLQTFQYDGFGRITSMSDNNVHIPDPNGYYNVICSYAFDSLSRQLYEKQTLGKPGFNSTKTVSFNYDASCGNSSRPSSLIYPDGTQINNTYDKLGRLIARRRQGDDFDIGRYDWIGAGRRTVLTYPNGTRLTFIVQNGGENVYIYDALGRSLNHRWEKTDGLLGHGTLLMGFETRTATGAPLYDRAGNKMITYRTHQPSRSELYHYDSIGRLSGRGASLPTGAAFQRGTFTDDDRNSMDPSQGGVRDYYQEWDLDGLGNWTTFNDNTLTPSNRTHSEYNEIVTVPGITQNHDKNGNLRSDGTLLYFWDAFNRLKYIERISDNMGMGEFLYDAQNRRVFHTAPFQDVSTYGNARRYVYSGPQLIAEYFKPSGADEHLLEQYAYGVYLDEVWARQKMIPNVIGGYNSEYLLFHHDPLYSVSGVTDPWGNLLEAYEYDPYGRRIVITDGPDSDSIVNFTSDDIRGTSSPHHVKPAFTGQIYDEESGLYYYKERYYHPGWGRFINRDPIGVKKLNGKYAYVESNPVNFLDPLGLWSLTNHRAITLTAFNELMDNNPSCKCKYKEGQLKAISKGLEEGSTFPDTLWEVGHGRERLGVIEPLFWSSHLGSRAFWHSMRNDEQSAHELMDKVSKRIFSQSLQGIVEMDYGKKGFKLAEGLHTLEDTYCRSHVIREGNLIKHFQEYSAQSKNKHNREDENTSSIGYNSSITAVKGLMDIVFCKPGNNRQRDIEHYVNNLLQINNSTEFKGTNGDYKEENIFWIF
jgi:RHS repeat-associated protein